MSAEARPCRWCHERPAIRCGLSTRLCANCIGKKRPPSPKPERSVPSYKLTRPVSRHGVTVPNTDISKGNHRDRSLLDLAHYLYDCTNCGRHIPEGLEPAHANAGMTESKGLGLKASDAEHAALCHWCHRWLDQGGSDFDPSGRYTFNGGERREMWIAAYFKTQAEYWSRGWLRVA